MSTGPVLVLDLGGQYAQLIARRVREAGVYSELVGHGVSASEAGLREPAALILSGGPASVYAADAPQVDPALFELGVPTLGICYGAQLMAKELGGAVERTDVSEFGKTALRVDGGELFAGLAKEQVCWMSHRDTVTAPPEGAQVTAGSASTPVAAFEAAQRGLYGVQFHPEVVHTPDGQAMLENFLYRVAGASPGWTATAVIDEQVERIRAQVGSERVLCGLSGGVDSAVAALLVHRAVGDQLTCVFVDHGLLRKDEAMQVVDTFGEHFHVPLVHVDAEERFLARLEGIDDPEEKRRRIGEEFIRVFEDEARRLGHGAVPRPGDALLGRHRVRRRGRRGRAHQVPSQRRRACPTTWRWSSSSRSVSCSRTRCGVWGRSSGCPRRWSGGIRFPGRGSPSGSSARSRTSAWRRSGRPTPSCSRRCDAPASTASCGSASACCRRSVRWACKGDERTYGYPIVIRAVTSEDAMTADWARLPHDLLETVSGRIVNEIPAVNRVVYDVTSKPPSTIEWE